LAALAGWLAGWQVGCAGWLAGYAGWMASLSGWLAGCAVCWLAG